MLREYSWKREREREGEWEWEREKERVNCRLWMNYERKSVKDSAFSTAIRVSNDSLYQHVRANLCDVWEGVIIAVARIIYTAFKINVSFLLADSSVNFESIIENLTSRYFIYNLLNSWCNCLRNYLKNKCHLLINSFKTKFSKLISL